LPRQRTRKRCDTRCSTLRRSLRYDICGEEAAARGQWQGECVGCEAVYLLAVQVHERGVYGVGVSVAGLEGCDLLLQLVQVDIDGAHVRQRRKGVARLWPLRWGERTDTPDRGATTRTWPGVPPTRPRPGVASCRRAAGVSKIAATASARVAGGVWEAAAAGAGRAMAAARGSWLARPRGPVAGSACGKGIRGGGGSELGGVAGGGAAPASSPRSIACSADAASLRFLANCYPGVSATVSPHTSHHGAVAAALATPVPSFAARRAQPRPCRGRAPSAAATATTRRAQT
jgi:hypothetical protein